MLAAFIGVGDGRSGYCVSMLTGRLFPSTTFSCTTARNPFGPSMGVRTGSSYGEVGGSGETVLRLVDTFLDTEPDEGDNPSPEYEEVAE